MYDELRAWFETYQADEYTQAVVAALVDCAETLWHADGMIGEPLGSEAHQALGDLQAALLSDEPATAVEAPAVGGGKMAASSRENDSHD